MPQQRQRQLYRDEIDLILNDQRLVLESHHIASRICPNMQWCPPNHFEKINPSEIFMRQQIIVNITEILGG